MVLRPRISRVLFPVYWGVLLISGLKCSIRHFALPVLLSLSWPKSWQLSNFSVELSQNLPITQDYGKYLLVIVEKLSKKTSANKPIKNLFFQFSGSGKTSFANPTAWLPDPRDEQTSSTTDRRKWQLMVGCFCYRILWRRCKYYLNFRARRWAKTP